MVATPGAQCGPGSRPEPGIQGRVPAGSANSGLWCNLTEVAHQGTSGGFKVLRYTDQQGHACAFYDTALLFPTNAINLLGPSLGVAVLDMSDPAHPVQTDTLTQLPMESPHESLSLNVKRGLLAAVNGNPATEPGLVAIYDAHADCRHPVLDSTSPGGAGSDTRVASHPTGPRSTPPPRRCRRSRRSTSPIPSSPTRSGRATWSPNLRLQVNQPADHHAAGGDPGTFSPAQGYAAHYCNIPTRVDPKIVACSFIASGLRVFDISQLTRPREIGYFVAPTKPNTETGYTESDYAMSQPAFDSAGLSESGSNNLRARPCALFCSPGSTRR